MRGAERHRRPLPQSGEAEEPAAHDGEERVALWVDRKLGQLVGDLELHVRRRARRAKLLRRHRHHRSRATVGGVGGGQHEEVNLRACVVNDDASGGAAIRERGE